MTSMSSVLSRPVESEISSKKLFLCHKSWYLLSDNLGSGDLVVVLNVPSVKKEPVAQSVAFEQGHGLLLSSEEWDADFIIGIDVEHITALNIFIVPVSDERAEIIKLLRRARPVISDAIKKELIGLSSELKERYIEQNYERYAIGLIGSGVVNVADYYIEKIPKLMGFCDVKIKHQGA
jgi:hypothetical protein